MNLRNIDLLLTDPAISDWLKHQIMDTKQRDVLDALNDAKMLVSVLRARWASLAGSCSDPQT